MSSGSITAIIARVNRVSAIQLNASVSLLVLYLKTSTLIEA